MINQFKVSIRINATTVSGKIYDLVFDSEYTLFRVEDSIGAFASMVKEAYIELLNDIKDKFTSVTGKSGYLRALSDHYGWKCS